MKKLLRLCAISCFSALLLQGCTTASKPKDQTGSEKPVIDVIQLMEHTSLNMIYDSFYEEMKQLGYVDKENCTIVLKNAQGEQSNIGSIISTFQSNNPAVVVAIATPAAQGAAMLAEKTPVIFSAVTDPIEAGLIRDLNKPDQNITGTSDAVMVDQILQLAMTLVPEMKKIGFLYNAGEANSASNIGKAKAYAESQGLEVIEAVVTNTSEVAQATQVLTSKVDVIFTPNDNTVATAMSTVTEICRQAKTPIFVGADSMVMDGGLATVGINYVELGKETARMVDQVLKGTPVSEIPVKVFQDNLNIFVNQDALEALGMTLPESVATNEKLVQLQDK